MSIPTAKLMAFIRDEDAVTAVEYGMMAGLIAAALVGAVAYVAVVLDTNLETVASFFPTSS